MFITAMAANPLAVNLATEALGQTISWGASVLRLYDNSIAVAYWA